MEKTKINSPIFSKSKEYKIKGVDNNIYSITVLLGVSTLIIQSEIENVYKFIYKAEISLEEFKKLNQFFKQFDTINEIFSKFFETLQESEIVMTKLDNQIQFCLKLEIRKKIEEIPIILKQEKLNSEDVIINLTKKVEEINELKEKNTKMEKELNDYKEKLSKIEEDIKNIKNNYNSQIEILTEKINILIEEDFASNIIKDENRKKFIELIKPGIKNLDKSKKIKFKLLFRATEDGDNIAKFHKKCDNKGKTVSIIQTKNDFIFGGYTDHSWNDHTQCTPTTNTFIFSLNKNKIYQGKNGGFICCNKEYGPWFCSCAGVMNNYFSKENSYQWELKEIEKQWEGFKEEYELVGGKRNFLVKEVEVYKVIFI